MNIRDAILFDAQKRLENLKNFDARRREWYEEQNLRIADRQSQHIIFVSSISTAILAITATSSITTLCMKYAFWSLLVNVILGTVLYFWLNKFDSNVLKKERVIVISILKRLKDATENVVKNPNLEEYFKHTDVFRNEINEIESMQESESLEKSALNLFYILFLLTFLVGILFIAFAKLA